MEAVEERMHSIDDSADGLQGMSGTGFREGGKRNAYRLQGRTQ